MQTPLYKFLKSSGNSFYAFPGAAEDVNLSIQNDNYKISFDKFVLLDLPKENLVSGTANNPIQFNFTSDFYRASPAATADYSTLLIESLRNYVANHETTIKETKLNSNQYFYTPTDLSTTTEKIFWKWCKKLNIIQWEKATPGDEYFDNLDEFQPLNINDDTYFPEILWRERDTSDYRAKYFYQTGLGGTYSTFLEVEFETLTNFRTGDIVNIHNNANSTLLPLNGLQPNVLVVIPPSGLNGQRVVLDIDAVAHSISGTQSELYGEMNLVYNKLVQYVGEITAVNNVVEANKSYTEIYAHIGDAMGQTPDILFRLGSDNNYKPNLEYPILPTQYQPEIIGAENFTSPIVSTPQNYPGDYYGQFDTSDFTYKNSLGDLQRRSGDYYGVYGDINNITINPTKLDGVGVDFNPAHYVKMNIIGDETNSFDEFNQMPINGVPAKDYSFNAILWYYTVTDLSGTSYRNLYGISFVDHPDNNPNPSLVGKQIPEYKKLVNNGVQDGTSYAFSLNLNYNISNDMVQPQFSPNNINSLFSFNLFNEAMKRLASANDSFLSIITKQGTLEQELLNIKGLLYAQTDITTINDKIKNLETLLKLYQSLQIVSSDTIKVTNNTTQGQPTILLESKDSSYYQINNISSTDLYNSVGIIPMNIPVPDGKNFLVNIVNNDENNITLPNGEILTIVLDRDLDYKQSVDIFIDGSVGSTQNKRLDIYVKYDDGTNNSIPTETILISSIDLPVYFNEITQLSNTAKTWNQVYLPLDMTQTIELQNPELLKLPLVNNKGFKKGDTILLDNFILGVTGSFDYSGQYVIDVVGTSSSYLSVDVNSNPNMLQYYNDKIITNTLPININVEVNSQPYITLNKGYNFKVTRVSQDTNSSLVDRYKIEGGLVKN